MDSDIGTGEIRSIFKQTLRPRLRMDITPLVDIVFLLVAFFMLSSSLGKDQTLFVDLPKAKQSKTSPAREIVITVDSQGQVYLHNQKLSDKNYQTQLITEIKKIGTDRHIIIRGDKKSPYEKIVGIMDTLSEQGIKNFALSIQRQ